MQAQGQEKEMSTRRTLLQEYDILYLYLYTMRKQGNCLEKEIIQGTMPDAHKQGRPRTDIKTWTGLPVEESVRMTEDRDKWRKYIHGVANLRVEDG